MVPSAEHIIWIKTSDIISHDNKEKIDGVNEKDSGVSEKEHTHENLNIDKVLKMDACME